MYRGFPLRVQFFCVNTSCFFSISVMFLFCSAHHGHSQFLLGFCLLPLEGLLLL